MADKYVNATKIICDRVCNDPVKIVLEYAEPADVVPKSVFEQVVWERDLAIQQLKEDYGVGLGEVKKELVSKAEYDKLKVELEELKGKQKKGHWDFISDDYGEVNYSIDRCSVCGEMSYSVAESSTNYCPYCGAEMSEGEE